MTIEEQLSAFEQEMAELHKEIVLLRDEVAALVARIPGHLMSYPMQFVMRPQNYC